MSIQGPAIFLAQFAGSTAPFNSLTGMAKWAADLGYRGIQVPTNDSALFDLTQAAASQDYCDEILGRCRDAGVEITELSTHLQGQLVAVHPAYDELFDNFAPEALRGKPAERTQWAIKQLKLAAKASQNLGLTAHATFSGALLWHLVYPWPQRPAGLVEQGFAELAARQLVSGNARIMDAMMLLFKLYFGALLGIEIGFALFGVVDFVKPEPISRHFAWLAVGILVGSLVVLFKSRGKYTLWSMAAGFIAYGASYTGGMLFDATIGAFLGAFAVGLYSNLFTRLANAPAVIVAMHGLIVLVPGSKTYIGLNSLISGQDFVVSDRVGQQTFLILMALVAGLIFANVALPPKKSL